MGSNTYGYVRVSTQEQNETRQLTAMREFGVEKENIIVEKLSGKDFQRPRYQRLVRLLKPGDVLVIKSIDRLGRDYEEIQNQWRVLTREKGVDIVVLDMPLLDTRRGKDLVGTFLSDVVLQVLSFVAENERSTIRQRQAEGIAAATRRGVRFGRPCVRPPEDFPQIVEAWRAGQLSFRDALERSGLAEATFYRRLREHSPVKSAK